MADGNLAVPAITAMATLLVSWRVAKAYGDVAGTRAAIRFEKQKDAERGERILKALHAEVEALSGINQDNISAIENQLEHLIPAPYPTIPFEVAIFSGEGIDAGNETIRCATDYLLKARQLNAIIEALRAANLVFTHSIVDIDRRRRPLTFLLDQAKGIMPQRIENLKACIEAEISTG